MRTYRSSREDEIVVAESTCYGEPQEGQHHATQINTDGIQFRVAGPARPKQDYKDKERQATTRDGEPIWTVRLDAIEPEREARETIWVEVAGEQPRLTFDGYAVVHGLVFAPWVGRDGKIKRAFRAESVEPSGPAKSAQAA